MSAVSAPAPEKRKVALLEWGGAGGVQLHVWTCPVGCGFEVRDRTRRAVVLAMRAHSCNGGWCPVPFRPGVKLPDWPVPERYVSPEVAARYTKPR